MLLTLLVSVDCSFVRGVSNYLFFLVLWNVAESAPALALQPLDLLQSMNLDEEDSKEEAEEEEATPHVTTKVRVEVSEEQSPSNVIVVVLM